MIELKHLITENHIHDTERFIEPLSQYLKNQFSKEYNDKQLMMFGITVNELINAFLEKILDIHITYEFSRDQLPHGYYDAQKNEIFVLGINYGKYRKSGKYQKYVDSVIFHELIHAVNFHKKLWNKIVYDTIMPDDKYYGDPEEIRAYHSQIKDFLVSHLGLTRRRAESLMNKYSSDKGSKYRKKWMSKYYDLEEGLEYPLAKGEDRQSYADAEGWKGKLVWMTPDKFLELAAPLPGIEKNTDKLTDLEMKMKTGKPLDFLVLTVDMEKRKVIGHEGRHRATVAKKLGIEKVPVLIYVGSVYKRVPKWTKSDHEIADKLQFRPEKEK